MSTKINLYKQSGTDVDTRVNFNVPRSLTYGLNARANDDGGVSESDNCEYNTLNTLYGINYEPLPIQPETAAYLAFTGITGTTEVNAINKLVYELKQNNLWSKMKAVYPFVTDNRNLASYTENFTNAYWSKVNLSATLEGTNLSSNFYKIADSINGVDNFFFLSQNLVVGTTYTVSANFKKGEYEYVQIHPSSSPGAKFNLADGTIIYNTVTNATITNIGDGWYRCSITFTAAGAAIHFSPNKTAVGYYNYSGTIGSGIYMQSPQFDLGTVATPYQPIITTQQEYISTQFKYNLIDGFSFKLVFNGGWNMSNQGATPNGVNGYADTQLVPSSVLTNNNYHLSHYSRTQKTNANEIDLGADNGTASSTLAIDQYYLGVSGKAFVAGGFPTYSIVINNTDTLGLLVGTRTSSTSAKLFMDGSFLAQNTTANVGTLPNLRLYLSAINTAGNVAAEYSAKQTAFSSIGDGLTDSEASILYSLVQQYQTFLNRAI
jgi:hypothetical protein